MQGGVDTNRIIYHAQNRLDYFCDWIGCVWKAGAFFMGCLGYLGFIAVSPLPPSLPPLHPPAALLWDRLDRETSLLPVRHLPPVLFPSFIYKLYFLVFFLHDLILLFFFLLPTAVTILQILSRIPFLCVALLASSTNTSGSTVLNFVLRLRSLLFTQSTSARFAHVVINARIPSWLPATCLPTKCATCLCEHAIERYFRDDLNKSGPNWHVSI